jgi:hypothetical protein
MIWICRFYRRDGFIKEVEWAFETDRPNRRLYLRDYPPLSLYALEEKPGDFKAIDFEFVIKAECIINGRNHAFYEQNL